MSFAGQITALPTFGLHFVQLFFHFYFIFFENDTEYFDQDSSMFFAYVFTVFKILKVGIVCDEHLVKHTRLITFHQ